MKKPRFTRARRPEQKDERRAQLLGTARALLQGGVALRELSLNELARRAGMAKANVYRYFETREAVLLALLWAEWERWAAWLLGELEVERKAAPGMELEALVAKMAGSLAREPLLCALTAALPSVLEQNLSEDAIRGFKQSSLAVMGQVASALAARCPALPAAAWAEFVNDTVNAITGLYPATHPSEAAARVLESGEFAFFKRDFGTELARFMGALAANHAARHARATAPAARAYHRPR